MKKHIAIVLIAGLAIASCNNNKEFTISGEMTNHPATVKKNVFGARI